MLAFSFLPESVWHAGKSPTCGTWKQRMRGIPYKARIGNLILQSRYS